MMKVLSTIVMVSSCLCPYYTSGQSDWSCYNSFNGAPEEKPRCFIIGTPFNGAPEEKPRGIIIDTLEEKPRCFIIGTPFNGAPEEKPRGIIIGTSLQECSIRY